VNILGIEILLMNNVIGEGELVFWGRGIEEKKVYQLLIIKITKVILLS
jgi:hypothetical protein